MPRLPGDSTDDDESDVANAASLLADPSRAAIVLALCDDRPVAAGELALPALHHANRAKGVPGEMSFR